MSTYTVSINLTVNNQPVPGGEKLWVGLTKKETINIENILLDFYNVVLKTGSQRLKGIFSADPAIMGEEIYLINIVVSILKNDVVCSTRTFSYPNKYPAFIHAITGSLSMLVSTRVAPILVKKNKLAAGGKK